MILSDFGVSDDCLIYFTATPVSSVPDPTLFSWDIGQIFLQKTAEKEDELEKAFQMLDVGQTLTVTKGEFRRVIETFLFHLTEAEFDVVLAEVCYVIAVYNHLEAVPIYVKSKISMGAGSRPILSKKC